MAQNLLALLPKFTAVEKAWILWAMKSDLYLGWPQHEWDKIGAYEIGFLSREWTLEALRMQTYPHDDVGDLLRKLDEGR